MKETAVEWLIKQIKEDQTIKAKSMSEWNIVFEQAKKMEKEQIMESYNKGEFNQGCSEDSEQYFNKTFKSE